MKKKRVLLPFRYPGGKYYAMNILRPFWEAIDHDEYREPMVGGGAVFFAKPKVKFNWINDIHSDLITTYKVMANTEKKEGLIELVSSEVASKERHAEIKAFIPKTDLEIAFKYYYLEAVA